MTRRRRDWTRELDALKPGQLRTYTYASPAAAQVARARLLRRFAAQVDPEHTSTIGPRLVVVRASNPPVRLELPSAHVEVLARLADRAAETAKPATAEKLRGLAADLRRALEG